MCIFTALPRSAVLNHCQCSQCCAASMLGLGVHFCCVDGLILWTLKLTKLVHLSCWLLFTRKVADPRHNAAQADFTLFNSWLVFSKFHSLHCSLYLVIQSWSQSVIAVQVRLLGLSYFCAHCECNAVMQKIM